MLESRLTVLKELAPGVPCVSANAADRDAPRHLVDLTRMESATKYRRRKEPLRLSWIRGIGSKFRKGAAGAPGHSRKEYA